MKSVKIMLSAVLVMAVIAGALAFKVKKAQNRCVYTHTTSVSCPFWKKDISITTLRQTSEAYGTTLVIPASGVCPNTTNCPQTVIAE